MKNIGFSHAETEQILDILVAILNLGNIQFEEGKKGGGAIIKDESSEFVKIFEKHSGIKDMASKLLLFKVQDMMGE